MKSLIGSTVGSLTLIILLVSGLFYPVLDLAQVAIIYKTIEWNLAINRIWSKIVLHIFGYMLEPKEKSFNFPPLP